MMTKRQFTLGWLFSGLIALGQGHAVTGNPGTPWPATDALDLRVPTADEVGPFKLGRL